jgi:hypothetical protein
MAVKETNECATQPIGPSDKDQHKDLQFGKSCERGRERERHDLGKFFASRGNRLSRYPSLHAVSG